MVLLVSPPALSQFPPLIPRLARAVDEHVIDCDGPQLGILCRERAEVELFACCSREAADGCVGGRLREENKGVSIRLRTSAARLQIWFDGAAVAAWRDGDRRRVSSSGPADAIVPHGMRKWSEMAGQR